MSTSTLGTYDRYWKFWADFIALHHGPCHPLLINVPVSDRSLIVIDYMAHLHGLGFRGSKILSIITGVKQSMVLKCIDVSFFNDAHLIQAKKSCRFSNQELKNIVMKRVDSSQLPFTMEMYDKAFELFWSESWSSDALSLRNGIFLCISLAMDTGRRISNFTLKDGPSKADHALRCNEIFFHLSSGSKVSGGLAFRNLFESKCLIPENVTMVEIYFPTQKQSYVNNVVVNAPVFIRRDSPNSSTLVDHLVAWALHNVIDGSDVFFTCSRGIHSKGLTQKHIRMAIKEVATACGLDPARFGTHSLRRFFASTVSAHGGDLGEAFGRAGWSVTSKVPKKFYVTPTRHVSGLSHK